MSEQIKKPKKKKGPIRTEVVVPLIIVSILVYAYFHFFFDLHLKKGLEFLGYQVVGAEVNIQDLETNFIKGSFRMQGIQVTNSQKPEKNMVEIGDIRFDVRWDGLLRARFVVDEMAVEQIQIDSARKSPGKVKPPEPPPKDQEPSALEKAAVEVKNKALNQTKSKYSNNVLGDLAALLSGASGDAQLDKIEGTLKSKEKLASLEAAYKEKSKIWEEKIQSLPKPKEISDLGDRLAKIKTSNFKSPQELVESLNQLKSVAEDADKKYKQLQETGQTIDADLKMFDQGLKELDSLVKKDVAELESRFRIPKLDPKNLAEGIFRSYLDPYLARMNEYKQMAEKYMPPNVMKKDKPDEPDVQIQPRPRAKGVTYEFGKPRSYPMLWIKKISITSKANAQLGIGDVDGKILNVTTNQILIGEPTVASIKGDYPGFGIQGFLFKGTFDNLKSQSAILYETSIAQYPMEGRELVESDDVQIRFKKADASFESKGSLKGFRDLEFTLQQGLKKVDYEIQAKNTMVDEILKSVFTQLPVLTLDVKGEGKLPGLGLAINSNLGPELQRGFEREVKKKIDEAKLKIQNYINDTVGKEKAKLEADYKKVKDQVDGEIKKLQAQLDKQKKQAESKSDQAKKDEENKAKNQLQNEGQKAVDDLKKKFGL